MGFISDLRGAMAPQAIAQAMRSSSTTSTTAPTARLGKTGPSVGRILQPTDARSTTVRYEAMSPDPQRWFSILASADQGHTGPMIDLFYDARLRDSHLAGVAAKRTQSMMGRPVVFRPPEGLETDPEALAVARDVRRILLTETRFRSADGVSLGFRSGLQHLMSAATDGYSVAPVNWTVNWNGEHVPHLEFAHGNLFGWDRQTRRLGFYESGRAWGNVCPLSEYQDRFVAHVPMNGTSDHPWRRGALRSCIVPSFLKREGLRFWLVLTERFGMPQPYAIVPAGIDDDGESTTSVVKQTKEALLSLSRHWAGVFGKGVEIGSIPGSGAVDADAHKALIDWAEMTTSIALLGQNLTTKVEGGSFAAAEAHRYVAGDIHLADATELGETITQQLVEPIVRYNWPGAPVPVCEISTGQKQVFTLEDVQEGVCSPDEYRRTKGHEAMSEGRGASYRLPAAGGANKAPGPKPEAPPINADPAKE